MCIRDRFDFNLICEYFSSMDRQGPGSPEMTLRALSFAGRLTADSHIADLGCGTGGQTMTLAQNTPARITGIDLFPAFTDRFNDSARKLSVHDRVRGITGSMDDLPFEGGELDLIWSEGAIYNIGFEKGLTYWRKFLKPGGYVAVTEASWFTDERPDEINSFWLDAYPGIDTIPNKVAGLQRSGYLPVACFILPEECWTDHFYVHQVKARQVFLEKHRGNKMAEELVENERREARLYERYSDYYGYVFYIGKKI
jgi:ubiquinone/menaquinone biosynthesis C-methylase UbiE